MEKLMIWHKVTDFDAWKEVFDAAAEGRAAGGWSEAKIHRFMLDPNTFLVEFEGDNMMDRLNTMLNDKSQAEAMKAAGVEKMDFQIIA